ncbi:MAG TPA: sensor histidine kinase, partial [Longimicrobiales bacterium]|nr:sensor histidine kinase [Longimicrobiales bacterium]
AATVALSALVMLSAVAPSILANRRWVADPQASTAVAVAMLVAAGLVLTNVVRVPLPLVAVAALVAAPVLPRFRRLLATATDRLMFADIRARSSASALETERARVAREIHDSPLQELSGVIRKLDLNPQIEAETEALRGVADQLRSIATELYPPVLDDLGLVAALRSFAHRFRPEPSSDGVQIHVAVTDDGSPYRPPPDVELAVLRIVQEAVNNAVAHAEARRVQIVGSVSPAAVHVSVVDDGRGIDHARARRAQQLGHMGLASMQQRAAAVGADLRFEHAKPSGTRVELRWQA